MKLGEIIKEYAEEHSISSFINDSGLSKAYVYMLSRLNASICSARAAGRRWR